MSKVGQCIAAHFGSKSPIAAYRREMAGDVEELIRGGMSSDSAWAQVAELKLAELRAERTRIEGDVAAAYGKTAAGRKAGFGQEVSSAPAQEQGAVAAPEGPGTTRANPAPGAQASTAPVEMGASGRATRIGKGSGLGIRHPATVMRSRLLAAVSASLGGLDPAFISEFSYRKETGRIGKDKRPIVQWVNPLIPGVGRLFRKGGTQDFQEIAELFEGMGFLDPGSVAADSKEAGERAKSMILQALEGSGDPQTTDERIAEQQRRDEEFAQDEAPDWMSALGDEELADDGYTSATPEQQEAVARLLADAEAAGLDAESIATDAARTTEGEPYDAYYQAIRSAVDEALARNRGGAGEADAGAARGGDQGRGETDGAQAQAGPDEGLTLQAQTAADLRAKTERERAGEDAERAKKAAEQARLKKEADDRDARARADQTVDDFQLGQSADQQMSGMGDLFAAPAAPAQPAVAPERFAAGQALTKAERKRVLDSLVDVYKAKGAPREQKGIGRDGNERYGYVYSPELFEKSDITGAMVRYYVTLPDGRRAHPSELFPDYTQADIDSEMTAREQRKRDRASDVQRATVPAQQFDTIREAAAWWDERSRNSISQATGQPTIFDSLERRPLTNGTKFILVPNTTSGEMLEAFAEAGWRIQRAERPAAASAAPEAQQAAPSAPAPAAEPQTLKQRADSMRRAPEGEKDAIADVGEKIGGARKDMAVSGGEKGARRKSDDDRPAWARRFQVSQSVTGIDEKGEHTGPWIIRDLKNTDWMGKPKQVGAGTYATKEEAEAVVPLAAVALKHRPVPTSGGKYEIWREISDRKRVKVVDQQFDTRDDAMRYMLANAVQIIETNTTFGESDMPLPPDRARSGPARRTGNVTGADFKDAFGLRGVEFGNWNNQDERQSLMNDAWDGLMDLADVLGVPPKALGLNGDLALAFGARGHGLQSARAHYERTRAVINLTKEKGAGSLAHEWFHAMDHYFGRQDGKAAAKWEPQADGTRTLKASDRDEDYVSHGFSLRSAVRPELREAYKALIQTMFKRAESYVEDVAKVDKFTGTTREELARELDKLRADLSEQKDARYWKRNNKPASAEQLAEFDRIAKAMVDGDVLAVTTEWRMFSKPNPSTPSGKVSAARWTNDSLERLSAIYKEVRGRSGFDGTNQNGVMDRLRGYMNRYSQRLKLLADAQSGTEKVKMVPTDFAMNAKELDQGRGGDYWTTPHEMAARAFQGYVEDKIAERGGVSRFLNYAPENAGILTPWGFKRPFPAGDERKAINAAMDKFVGALQTKIDDSGNVELREPSPSPYTAPYETDLFGDPVLPPTGGVGSRAARSAAATRDMEPSGGVPSAPAGRYATLARLVTTRQQRLGAASIKTLADSANALAYLGKSAVERLDAIVTDAAGKPLAVIGGFKGALSQTAVYPSTILGEAVQIPGAASVWLVHNHPSGSPELSRADEYLSNDIRHALDGTGIEVRGMVAVGSGGRWGGGLARDQFAKTASGSVSPVEGPTVPAQERQLEKSGTLGPSIGTPAEAKIAVEAAVQSGMGKPIILLLNSQNEPLAVIPWAASEAMPMRNNGRLLALYRAVAQANAGSALIGTGNPNMGGPGNEMSMDQAANIGAALKRAGVRVLDIIGHNGRSAAERGETLESPILLSRSPNSGAQGMSAQSLRAPLDAEFGADVVDALVAADLLYIENRPPPSIPGDVAGVTSNGAIGLFANNIPAGSTAAAYHEALHATLRKTIGDKAFDALMARMPALVNANAKWFAEASERVPDDTPERVRNEEMAAYAVEAYQRARETMPAGVRKWVQDFLAALKAALAKALLAADVGLGLRVRLLSDAGVLHKLARDGLKAMARTGVAPELATTFSKSDPDIRYSRASQDLLQPRDGIWDFNRLGETKQDRIKSVMDQGREFWLALMTRDQIADVYGKEIPPVREYDELTRSMENERQKRAQDAEALYGEWAKLPAEESQSLAALMTDATLDGLHPDSRYANLDDDERAKHERLAAKFDELTEPAKTVYRKVRDHHRRTLEDLRDALLGRIERAAEAGSARDKAIQEVRAQFDKYLTGGPYFPLSRFGDYLVIATRDDGERVVAAYENAGEQAAAARKLQQDGFTVKMKVAQKYSREVDGAAGKFIGDVIAMVDGLDMQQADLSGNPAAMKAQMLDDLNQLFIKALPDLSYRKHFAHRKGTPGYSGDMMRGFAHSAFHAASHIARLNHGDKMTVALRDAQDAISQVEDGDFNLHSQVLGELANRHDAMLNPNTHPVAAGLNQAGFLMYLGLGISSGLVNLMQTPMVTLPYLGARYGFGRASAAMSRATADIMKAPKNWRSGMDAAESPRLDADEKRMVKTLQDEGVIDLTQAHDLAAAGALDSGNVARSKAAFAWSRAMKVVGWTFHVPEVMNRQVTALMAYRLARQDGKAHEEAAEVARDAIRRTHFDYSSCVDADTEILTRSGWKRYTELMVGDTAIATDERGSAVPSKVLAVNVYEGEHAVIEFKSARRFSMVATPNHDCVVQTYTSRQKKWHPPRKVRADALRPHQYILRTPLTPLADSSPGIGEDMAALMGWVAAEGWYAKYRNCVAANDVRLGQSATHNPWYVDEIRSLLQRLGGHFKEYQQDRGRDRLATFVLRRVLGKRVQQWMPEKRLTPDLVRAMAPAEMRAFIMAFLKGDGCKSAAGSWNVAQKDGANLDLLQAMATMCGMRATLGELNGYGMRVLYIVPDDTGGRSHVRPLGQSRRIEPLVWCPTTEHGTWIARRNGAVFVTGNSNRARFMQGNLARVVFQFKQYAQQMTYMLGRAAHQWLKGETPEVRAIARRQLLAQLGATWAMSGALGLPIGAIGGLMAALAEAFDDDDKPVDWRVELRNALADTFGKEIGEVIGKGIPRALMPWDISGRVGLNDLWFRSSGREGDNPREAFANDVVSLLGPTASTALGFYTFADQWARGQHSKAVEAIMPKAARDVLKAYREGAEGVTDYRGDHLMDLTGAEVLGQFLGFGPSAKAEMMDAKGAVMQANTALDVKRRQLLADIVKARMGGDSAEIAELQSDVAAWNRRNPEARITPEQQRQSMQQRRDAARRTQDGITLPKKRDDLREIGRFAVIE